MSLHHDCSNCKGARFDGANLVCSRCLRPTFMECMDKRREVGELISIITNGLASQQSTTATTTTPRMKCTRLVRSIKSIFNVESVFEFVCPECKAKGTFMDIVKVLNDTIRLDKTSYKDLLFKYRKEQDILDKANELLAEKQNEIDYLKREMAVTSQQKDDMNVQLIDMKNRVVQMEKHQSMDVSTQGGYATNARADAEWFQRANKQ